MPLLRWLSDHAFDRDGQVAERCPEVGGLFIQMEDEIASITANVGAVWGGQKVMTVTSGPGFSLMMEKGVGGDVQAIPGVHHPIFRNQTVNKDPRELFLSQLFKERGESNVFHDFYSALMQALYDHGVTPNVFCVNIDAVIAALLLKTLWARYRSGAFSEEALESAAFTAFLFGRTVGCAGEIDLPHQPRAQHGHPHASIAMLLCRVR